MTKKMDLISPLKNEISYYSYYCTNHRINTISKKLLFKNNPCNGKITSKRNDLNFYLQIEHNEICNNKNPKIYDNTANVTSNAHAFSNYKEELIKFLNLNPLITFTNFKTYAIKKYLKGEFDCSIKKTLFLTYIILGGNMLKFLIGFLYLIII